MAEVRLSFALFLALLGCQPEIGDECQSSTDCAAGGDRLCDITQPGGYCTIFNCEPGTCPEEATCVLFSADRSTVAGCEDAYGTSPFQRSFCMASCESESDCRSGYSCIDVGAADNPWGAIVIDRGPSRVCIVPYSAAPLPEDRSAEVCTGSSGEHALPPEGGTSSGGEGGAPMSSSSAGAGGN